MRTTNAAVIRLVIRLIIVVISLLYWMVVPSAGGDITKQIIVLSCTSVVAYSDYVRKLHYFH